MLNFVPCRKGKKKMDIIMMYIKCKKLIIKLVFIFSYEIALICSLSYPKNTEALLWSWRGALQR